jgi:hypothetical protein
MGRGESRELATDYQKLCHHRRHAVVKYVLDYHSKELWKTPGKSRDFPEDPAPDMTAASETWNALFEGVCLESRVADANW